MPTLSPIDIARSYIDRGWSPIPVPFRTKIPVLSEWQNLRLDDETVDHHFNCEQKNVGVLLGEPSGNLVDIDLDCIEAIRLADTFLPKTEAIFGRKSKPRSHRLYTVTGEPGPTIRYRDTERASNGKQQTMVEYRSNGGQTIFPGSVHESGEPIEWDNDQPYSVNAGELRENVLQLAAATLLARHWPGSGGRHDARLALCGGLIRAGWAVENVGHFLNAVESVVPCQAKDAIADGLAAAKTTEQRWKVEGKSTGWPTLGRIIGESVVRQIRDWFGISGADACDVEPAEASEFVRPFPKHLLEPPGHVGTLVGWINQTAHRIQPAFALANALAFWGVVVGRKVAIDRTRTNLYTLGVGPSGCGKDHSRHAIKALCEASGSYDILGGEDLASDTALQKAAARALSILFQIDEIGHFLGNANSRYAGTHQRNIAPTFTKLFSSASSTFKGKEFADGEHIIVEQPNVGLYGTTVPERLYGGLTPEEVSDGFLARMLVFRADDADPPLTGNRMFDPPEVLVDAIVAWRNRQDLPRAAGNVAREMRHMPIQVPVDEGAVVQFNKLDALASEMKAKFRGDGGLDSIWARAGEHARKVALTVASGVAFEIEKLRVTEDVATYACELVQHLIDDFILSIRENIAGSDAERDTQLIIRALKGAGSKGLTRSELLLRTRRLTTRARDDAIKFLTEARLIGQREGDKSPRGGVAPTIYFLAKR